MSKQSERRKREFKKAKFIAGSMKAQEKRAEQSPKTESKANNGKEKPEVASPIVHKSLFDRAELVAIFAAVFALLAGFFQLYNHSIAIWVLFFALISFAHAAKIEIEDHKRFAGFANYTFWLASIVVLAVCCQLQKIELTSKPKSLDIAMAQPPKASPVTLETLGVVSKWKPPELPKDCPFVYVCLGGISIGCPPEILPDSPVPTNYFQHFIGLPGESPIEAYVKDNRFYIAVKNLLRTNLDSVFMSEDLAYPLPPKWDRNYDSNGFEIVSEDRLPILQIAYLQPNLIQVEGIFFISTNYGLIAFGNGFELMPFPIEKTDEMFSARKAWFVYPSDNHRGERAK